MDGNTRKCSYVWSIFNYPKSHEILQSPSFSAENNDSIKWFLRFRPRFYKNSEKNSSVHLVATSTDKINHHGAYVGTVTMNVQLFSRSITRSSSPSPAKRRFKLEMNNHHTYLNEEIYSFIFSLYDSMRISLTGSSSDNFNYFTVECEISYCKVNYSVSESIPVIDVDSIPFEQKTISNPLEDFGKLYLNEEHSDVTICIKYNGKQSEYPAHKIVLAVRSKVFEAMFRHEMRENNLNYVVVEDIREEVFLEVLRYIYTGQVIDEKLNAMVYELLPVADQYDLEKLRITCKDILRGQLSVQTVLKIVILADLHNVNDLKSDAVQFIKNHSVALARTMDSEAWGDLMARPCLMKDLLLTFMNKN